jgi:hypothetical protein
MTQRFQAKVNDIPCKIQLDDDYNISEIHTIDGNWVIDLPHEEVLKLEDQYDYIIAEIRREDEQDYKDYQYHMMKESKGFV